MFPYVLGYDFTFAVYGPMSALNLFVFLFLLLVGFIYEWLRGALVWPIFVGVKTKV